MSLQLSKTILLLLLFIAVGLLLRFWQLTALPSELHRDEAAIGYNAYSLLLTGHDEHGARWPINFRSFGDFKLPGLMYTTMLSIYFFGLTTIAVRLPTALAAVMTIPALFWLVQKIGFSKRTALFAAFFLTFDFWHIAQARNAYEPIVGLLFTVLGWASWLAAKKDSRYFIVAILTYLVGSLFYNIPFLLLPILYLGSWILERDWAERKFQLKAEDFWSLVTLGLVVACFLGISWLTQGVNAGKSNITVFSHPDILESSATAVHAGLVAGLPSLFSRILSHPFILGFLLILKGYVSAFDPTYLFFLGDHNPWHNLRSIQLGNMNPTLLLALLTGLYFAAKNWKQNNIRLAALYLFVTPVISSVTIDAPITNRLLDFHVAVIIFSAIGTEQLWQKISNFKTTTKWFLLLLATLIYFGFFGFFISRYILLYNPLMEQLWNPGLREVITVIDVRSREYDAIYVTPEINLGYIFFAFYTKFEPQDFQKNAKWIKVGFEEVSVYNKYLFKKFPIWQDVNSQNVVEFFNAQHSRILILGRGEPAALTSNFLLQKKDWRGQWRWYLWETDINSAIFELKSLPVTSDRTVTIKYLESCKKGQCDELILEK